MTGIKFDFLYGSSAQAYIWYWNPSLTASYSLICCCGPILPWRLPSNLSGCIHSCGTGRLVSDQSDSLLLHQTAGWIYICRSATVNQDVKTCFKLQIIIFNINCILMRHDFHSLHPLSISNKYFKQKQIFTHLRGMNMWLFNTSQVGLSVPWLFYRPALNLRVSIYNAQSYSGTRSSFIFARSVCHTWDFCLHLSGTSYLWI